MAIDPISNIREYSRKIAFSDDENKSEPLARSEVYREHLKALVMPNELSYNKYINDNSISEEDNMDAEKYFEILRKDREESEKRMQLAEQRTREERKESDARYEARMLDFENRMDDRFERMESKIDDAVKDIQESRKDIRGMSAATIALAITTILGIAALVIAVIAQ